MDLSANADVTMKEESSKADQPWKEMALTQLYKLWCMLAYNASIRGTGKKSGKRGNCITVSSVHEQNKGG